MGWLIWWWLSLSLDPPTRVRYQEPIGRVSTQPMPGGRMLGEPRR